MMKIRFYVKRLLFFLGHPKLIYYRLIVQFPKLIKDDEFFTKASWMIAMQYPLDLNNPQTFNEKLQWLKLYDHRPEYVKMVDKIEVKKYIADLIGEEYVIPLYEVYDSFSQIDVSNLPEQFVLKVSHDSGGVYICDNKTHYNSKKAKQIINKSLKRNYFYESREWPYKDCPPRVFSEKFMVDESGTELKDYKFFCFNGKVRFFKIDFDRSINHHANYYNLDGELLPFGETSCPPDYNKKIEIPRNIGEMISIAEKISSGIPFVRVDLYDVYNKIYFGEITFYPACGFGKFTDESWDLELGKYIELPDKNQNC